MNAFRQTIPAKTVRAVALVCNASFKVEKKLGHKINAPVGVVAAKHGTGRIVPMLPLYRELQLAA